MIDPTSYAAFTLAAFILLVIPGPTIMVVVAFGLSQGRRAAWASTLGVMAGDLVAVSGSLVGLGALMALSATAFTVVKWLGAAYLLYLAVLLWRESNRAGPSAEAADAPAPSARPVAASRIFRQTFVVTALNPKGIVFFTAFIPQFVDVTLAYWPQVSVYGVTFVVLGGVNALAYAYSAGRLSAFFADPRKLRWVKRVGAGLLGSASAYTVLAK